MSKERKPFVDFRAIRSRITMEQVLEHYGVLGTFKRSGHRLSGPCPIHNGNNRTQFRVDTHVLQTQVRIEREHGHRFVTDLVEAFPGEIDAVSIAKPSLEDVFIRRTGHRFWSEEDSAQENN